jgi:hypothetical protein
VVPAAVEVKVVVIVHEALAASVVLEQLSAVIMKFGEGPATMSVATVAWPILIGEPLKLVAVEVRGGVVVPTFPNVDTL